MKVITICGNMRYKKEMMKVTEELALKGYCILTPMYPSLTLSKRCFTSPRRCLASPKYALDLPIFLSLNLAQKWISIGD